MLTSLYSFTTSGTNGYYPTDGLRLGVDGNFYGTTFSGRAFKMTHAGLLNSIASLTGGNVSPIGRPALGQDGNFYGTGSSAAFKVTPAGVVSTVATFTGPNGATPTAGLLQAADGLFYGSTLYGGTSDQGTVFQVASNGNLITLFSLNGENGSRPDAELISGTDGNLYGTTSGGGSGGGGNIFLIVKAPPVIQSINRAGADIVFNWTSVAGQTYQVQYRTHLTVGGWVNLGGAVTATNNMTATVDVGFSESQRFYRVYLLPL